MAAAVALAAAIGEARGARIVPQVRRQVPESWRRVMPVPLAAGLYGVLLGLGFTTFILSFAVWALAGIAVALGDPALGVAIGVAFGAGRALPVIALAPVGGGRLHAAMAERPRILRSLRIVDAVALAGCAAALFAAPASAAVTVTAIGFSDPSVSGATLALHRPGATGELRGPAGIQPTLGNHPVVGGSRTRVDRGPGRRRARRDRLRRPGRRRRRGVRHPRRLAGRRGALRGAARRAAAARRERRRRPAGAGRPPARVRDRRPDRVVQPRDRRAHDAAPGSARAAARALGARRPARVREGDLPPPAGDDRPAPAPAPRERHRAVRDDPERPPRLRPRERPLPRPRPHQQAAVGSPAGRRHRHADDDRDQLDAVYFTRVRKRRGQAPAPVVLRVDRGAARASR